MGTLIPKTTAEKKPVIQNAEEETDQTNENPAGDLDETSDTNDEQANDHVQENSAQENSLLPTWLKVVTAVVAIPSMIWGCWYWWKSRQVPDSICTKILNAVGLLKTNKKA